MTIVTESVTIRILSPLDTERANRYAATMTTRDEAETSVAGYRKDYYSVYTADPVHMRRILGDDRFTVLASDDSYVRATVPASAYDPIRGLKRRSKPLTSEQKAALSDRLERARNSVSSA